MMTGNASNSQASQVQPDVRRRWLKVGEQEQQLRALLASKSPRNATVQQLRAVIRDSYEALLFLDFRFAVDHDVLYLLWRLHYSRIEEFRAQIRRIRSAPATSKAGSAQDRQPASVSILSRGSPATRRAQARPQGASDGTGDRAEASTAASAVAVYRGFLSEAAGFFHELVGKLKARRALLCDRGVADSQSQQGRAGDGDKWRAACQQCLVYLGDLARYRELVVDGDMATRDWSVAAGYYMQAAFMLPSTGNPHNQLAVLATYGGSEVAALYRYYRCIACKQPFATGRANLLVLFDQNVNRCNRLGATGRQAAQGVAQEAAGQTQGVQGAPAEALAVTWKNLCTRFVRLNGILFTHASLESFGAVYLAAMNDLERLLAAPPHALQPVLAAGSSACPTVPAASAEATVVVQMVACVVCTVHAMLAPHHAFPFAPRTASDTHDTRSTGTPPSAQLQQQADRLRHAVTLAFEFVGRLLSRCAASPAPLASPLFPAATVFLRWLAAHPHLATRTNDEATGPGGHAGEGAGGGGEDRESAARMFMWGQAVVVLNRLLHAHTHLLPPLLAEHQGGVQGPAGGHGESSSEAAGLWEDVELRGFEPLPHVCSEGPNEAQRDGHLDVDGWQGGKGGAEGQEAAWARGRRAVCAALSLSGWVQGGAGGAAWAAGDGSSSVLHFSRRHGRFFIASLVADQLPSPPAATAPHPAHVAHGNGVGGADKAAAWSQATASSAPSAAPARPAPSTNHHLPAAPVPWGAASMGSAGQGLGGGMAGVEAGGEGQGEEDGEGDGEDVPLWAVEELIGMDSSAEQSEQHMRELSAHTLAAHSERHNGVLAGVAANGGVEEQEEEEEMIVFQPWASGAAAAVAPHAAAPRATESAGKLAPGVQATGGGGRAVALLQPHVPSLPPSSSPSPRSSSPAMHTAPSPTLHPASPATAAAADGSLRRVPSGAGVIGQDRHRLVHTHAHAHAADLPGLWGAAPLHAAATAPPGPAPSAATTAPAGGSAALSALLGAGLSEHELSALLAKAHQLTLHPHAPPSAVRGSEYPSGFPQVSGVGASWPTSLTHAPPSAAAAPNSFFAGPSAAPPAAGQLPFPHLHAQQQPGYGGQQYGGGVQRGMGAVDQVMASSAFSAPSPPPPPAGSSAHTGAAPPPMPAMHAAAAATMSVSQAAAAQASLQPPQAAAAPNSWHWIQHAHHPWGP
ncbi:unnamed protein product [Closterium sp. Yama58-4]|nr:unnamed protein product [Closterium sp. Yama58-4]